MQFRGRTPTTLKFGTSGLRGLVSDMTDLEVFINTKGFLQFVPGVHDRVLLGGDLRPSTPRLMAAVATAAIEVGLEVVHCGLLPTPALALAALEHSCPCIMVTGSHIPFDRNGIKFYRADGEVLKTDEDAILESVARVRAEEYSRDPDESRFADDGSFTEGSAEALPEPTSRAQLAFTERYLNVFGPEALHGMRVAVYQHSAVGRDLLIDVLEGLGAEAIAVGRSDTFIAIDTENIGPELQAQLQALVDPLIGEHGRVHALVSTDGDSDRPLVVGVNESGTISVHGGDVLGCIVARALEARAAAFPVSVSDGVETVMTKAGTPYRKTKIGSPHVIEAMAQLQRDGHDRVMGWEGNGGFLLGTPIELNGKRVAALPTRDSFLPIVATLAQARGRSMAELFADLPPRFGTAGLLDGIPRRTMAAMLERLFPAEGGVVEVEFDPRGAHVTSGMGSVDGLDAGREAIMHAIPRELALGDLRKVNRLDGLRMTFEHGEVLHVRPSGNAPQMRLYVVAGDEGRAAQLLAAGLSDEGWLASLRRAVE